MVIVIGKVGIKALKYTHEILVYYNNDHYHFGGTGMKTRYQAIRSYTMDLHNCFHNPFRYIKDEWLSEIATGIIKDPSELYYEYNGRKRLIGKFPK